MRRALDALYATALWLSALCLIAIALLVGVQLAARLVDGIAWLLGLHAPGFVILSLNEIAGFFLAAASFFALAGTLKSGAHIRVTMLLSAFGEGMRRFIEMWAFGAAAVFCAYVTWSLGAFTYYSWKFNEVSSGLVPVQLAWPQLAMALGMAILTIALIDEFLLVARGGRPTFRAAEDAITLGKEG